jgi:hypothetical protein
VSDIDGREELVRLLDVLSIHDATAEHAPRSSQIYAYLSRGMASEGPDVQYGRLTETLIAGLSIWWSVWTYQHLPILVPWAIRDRAARYDQGPESWGAPRDDGYFRDDNSIIKKLPLPLTVAAPMGHPYRGRRPWRGFTACHIWRDLPAGRVGGADPFLYSFIPNLVWLPSPLAPLTDRQDSNVQQVLQRTSRLLYQESGPHHLQQYTDYAWRHLPAPPKGHALETGALATFEGDLAFVRRRLEYIDRVAAGADAAARSGAIPTKLISSRYTEGLPRLQSQTLEQFRDVLRAYSLAATESAGNANPAARGGPGGRERDHLASTSTWSPPTSEGPAGRHLG